MKTYILIAIDKIKFHAKKNSSSLIFQALPIWIASIVTGIIAVLYAKIFQLAEKGFSFVYNYNHLIIFILTPICFLIAVFIVDKFSPFARGSGIPQVSAAIDLATPQRNHLVNSLLNTKIIIVKIVSSSILALGGGVTGREGPTIQIASSIFRKVNMILPDWWPKVSKKNMIMTGAAAGLAAAFNTPLGGIVFALEELTKTHISFFKTALLSAVIIAGITAQSILGPYLYLGNPDLKNFTTNIFLPVIIVAILCGVISAYSCKLILKIAEVNSKNTSKTRKYLYVICCALFIAWIGILAGEKSLNSGKEIMAQLLFTNDKEISWYIPVLRILGSIATFTSGAAAGIFAPALSAGASIGSVISTFINLPPSSTNLIILVSMVAFLTGITRSPFTSAILVLEMTNSHSVIFHLMLAALISNLIAYLIDKHGLYDHLKKQYTNKLIFDDTERHISKNNQVLQ